MQNNDYYQIRIVTLDLKTVYKVLAFDKNTWYMTVFRYMIIEQKCT